MRRSGDRGDRPPGRVGNASCRGCRRAALQVAWSLPCSDALDMICRQSRRRRRRHTGILDRWLRGPQALRLCRLTCGSWGGPSPTVPTAILTCSPHGSHAIEVTRPAAIARATSRRRQGGRQVRGGVPFCGTTASRREGCEVRLPRDPGFGLWRQPGGLRKLPQPDGENRMLPSNSPYRNADVFRHCWRRGRGDRWSAIPAVMRDWMKLCPKKACRLGG